MLALDESKISEIARFHNISYDTPEPILPSKPVIKTRMARVFRSSQEDLYGRISNLKDHTRVFSHLTAINVIGSDQVAHVIGDNQYVIVEGIAEGGAKLGIKLVTLQPPHRIECELFTDLFASALYAMRDPKAGAIAWEFESVGDGYSRMQIKSEFEVGSNTSYVRGTIDHVWLDFFENIMVDLGELQPDHKLCSPFPERRNK